MKTYGVAAWQGGIKDGKGAISTRSGALNARNDRGGAPHPRQPAFDLLMHRGNRRVVSSGLLRLFEWRRQGSRSTVAFLRKNGGISGDAVPSKRVGREKVRRHRGQAKSSEEVGLYGVRGTGARAGV